MNGKNKHCSEKKRIKACMEFTDIKLRERENAYEYVKACQQYACKTIQLILLRTIKLPIYKFLIIV